MARVLEDRYHQANAKVATITGTTTTSMIAVELISRSSCAEAIGPWGSNMPAGLQEARRMAALSTDQRSLRERKKRLGGRAALLIAYAHLDSGPQGVCFYKVSSISTISRQRAAI